MTRESPLPLAGCTGPVRPVGLGEQHDQALFYIFFRVEGDGTMKAPLGKHQLFRCFQKVNLGNSEGEWVSCGIFIDRSRLFAGYHPAQSHANCT